MPNEAFFADGARDERGRRLDPKILKNRRSAAEIIKAAHGLITNSEVAQKLGKVSPGPWVNQVRVALGYQPTKRGAMAVKRGMAAGAAEAQRIPEEPPPKPKRHNGHRSSGQADRMTADEALRYFYKMIVRFGRANNFTHMHLDFTGPEVKVSIERSVKSEVYLGEVNGQSQPHEAVAKPQSNPASRKGKEATGSAEKAGSV